MTQTRLLGLCLFAFLLGILLIAFTSDAHASTANAVRADVNANDVSPLQNPIDFSVDVTLDECAMEATRFRILDVEGGSNEIASGVGSQTATASDISFYPVGGPYQPHIYYFTDAGYMEGDPSEACSSADVFDPFSVGISLESYPQGYNVSFSALELLYWLLGTAFVIYMVLRLIGVLIGNKW